MALNPQYMIAPSVQEFFVDKFTGLPMAGGLVYFKIDGTNILKPIYTLTAPSTTSSDFGYVQLPNPVPLTGVGTFSDGQGNDVLPYYYPYDQFGNVELYTIEVYNSEGTPQFTRRAYPNIGGTAISSQDFTNYVTNGQFWTNNTVETTNNQVPAGETVLAPGGWYYDIPSGSDSVDQVTFQPLPYTGNPLGAPRFALQIQNVSGGSSDASKQLNLRFPGVNTFAGETLNFYFSAFATGSSVTVTLSETQYFGGTGATPGTTTPTQFPNNTAVIATGAFAVYSFSITMPSATTTSIGTNNDDWVELNINLPIGTPFEVEFTDFVLTLTPDIKTFPITTTYETISSSIAGSLPLPNPNGSNLYLPIVLGKTGFVYDNSVVGQIIGKTQLTAVNNELLMDGSTKVASAYSPLGIPYQRLMNYLLLNSPAISITQGGLTATLAANQVPMYGTGANFVTLFNKTGAATSFFVQLNTAASGTVADVNTGWTFATTVANTTYTFSNVSAPTAGQYWTFTDGLAGLVYNVYYTINGVGAAPATPTGANIKVNLTGTITAASTIAATLIAVNQYQFAVLNTAGLFWRGLDTAGTYDLDYASRLLSGITFDTTPFTGAHLGSLETQQFLLHSHTGSTIPITSPIGVSAGSAGALVNATGGSTEAVTMVANGGSETRPVNLVINYFIKY